MTDDLSLLKSAAIAIGGEYIPAHEGYCLSLGGVTRVWNPLMDDGDAFRLSVKLGLGIWQYMLTGEVSAEPHSPAELGEFTEWRDPDPLAATRRAIVRAAAALGAAMEGKQ